MRKSVHCAQIAPTSAGAGGVGDFADKLAIELRKRTAITIDTYVPAPSVGHYRHPFSCTPASLFQQLNHSGTRRVVLHYVGYGYSPRGTPWELVRTLARWRRVDKENRLAVLFHELYATTPLFSTTLFTTVLQRYLVRVLVRAADWIMTSTHEFHAILNRLDREKRKLLPALPVFSTIGEPDGLPIFETRTRAAVVFGSPAIRGKVYADPRRLTTDCKAFNVDQIIDIGHPLPPPPRGLTVPWRPLGPLEDRQIIQLLTTARLGFLAYWAAALEKSSIFAAYSACGLPAIVYSLNAGRPQPEIPILKSSLTAGFSSSRSCSESLAAISTAAHRWYQTHNLHRHVERLIKVLGLADDVGKPFDTSCLHG